MSLSDKFNSTNFLNQTTDHVLLAISETSIISLTDTKGKILDVNDNFIKISGYEKSELIGKDHRIINSGGHPKQFFKDMWESISSGQIWTGVIRNKRKDGQFYWVETAITPLFDSQGKVNRFLSIRFDVTERYQQQAQIFQSSKMAALGEMASGIAHEINNPLTIILGRLQSLEKKLSVGSVESLQSLNTDIEKLWKSAIRIQKIIKGMQTLTRNGSLDTPEATCLTRLINEVLDLYGDGLEKKGVKITVQQNLLDKKVVFRPSHLEQILISLINNAKDAIGNLNDKWIEIETNLLNAEFAQIKVTDSGSGIPEVVAQKIMDPFFTTKPPGQGTGLGLSIAVSLAKLNNGTLIYNGGSKNTQFILTLPIY